jgi:8-oxo-dGTP pyrophosphatase MutT (NUDIX family)
MKITTICFSLHEGKIFLSRKKIDFGKGFLNGYGGKQELSDMSIEDAAVRELQEECAITALPNNLEKVAVIDFFEGKVHLFECHIFFCTEWSGEFCESEEMALAQPYDISNPPYAEMWSGDIVWLPLLFSGQKIKARLYYNEGMTKQTKFEHEPL